MSAAESSERWGAIRALREGKLPTFSLLVLAASLDTAAIQSRASREREDKSVTLGK